VGKKETTLKRVVLDTNILVSALLFRGEVSKIYTLWNTGAITPVISKDTFNEFMDVLGYPKFKLTRDEIKAIIDEEVLPYFEVIDNVKQVSGVCKDPDDDKFIACAIIAGVELIVSGDAALCKVKKYKTVKVVSASEFLKQFAISGKKIV
jgi:putative PIN family toxin of toxin-antitoxin system